MSRGRAAAVSGRSVREYSESDFECILGELRRRGAVGGAAGRGPEPDGLPAATDAAETGGRRRSIEPELDAAYRDSAASEKSQEEALIESSLQFANNMQNMRGRRRATPL